MKSATLDELTRDLVARTGLDYRECRRMIEATYVADRIEVGPADPDYLVIVPPPPSDVC